MKAEDEARFARLDAALIAIWAGVSLFARRLLGEYPVVARPTDAVAAFLGLPPSRQLWWPLLLYASLIPLAASLFYRRVRDHDLRLGRLGLACGLAGFGLWVVGLSLNLVEAAAAAASVTGGLPGEEALGLERSLSLWLLDQSVSIASLWLLAGWMATLSWIDLRRDFPSSLPRWFGYAGLAAAGLTAGAGTWGVIRQGSLLTVDGGDGLILVHLWIGLAATLVWQATGTRVASR